MSNCVRCDNIVNGRPFAKEAFFMTEQVKKSSRKGLTVKMISYAALFSALSIVANVFTVYFSINGTNALSFTYTVCFLAGALCGPLVGGIVGFVGDVLGWVINSTGGAFNPVITLSSVLIGVISGFVFLISKKTGKPDACVVPTIISFIFIFLICTNINTIGLYFYYMSGKYTFWAYYIIRTPKQLILWAINMVICIIITKPMKKLLRM